MRFPLEISFIVDRSEWSNKEKSNTVAFCVMIHHDSSCNVTDLNNIHLFNVFRGLEITVLNAKIHQL